MKKNLKKIVPFVTVLCVFAFVTAGCQNMVLAELLRNHRKIPPQPELDGLTIKVKFVNPVLAESLSLPSDVLDATPSQITANPSYIDYVLKVPHGTISATVTDFIPTGGSFGITFSPQSRTMALPSKKPVTIKVKDSGGASKTYSVYFVVCPEAYYVSANGNDRNSGDSPERPFEQLKTALDAASNSRVVNKVVVMGTLKSKSATGLEDSGYTFNLKGYGLPDDDNPDHKWNKDRRITISGMNEATLDAKGLKGVMTIRDSYLIFENITITGGFTNKAKTNNDVGGGLAIYGTSNITLSTGTRVIGNTAEYGAGGIRAVEWGLGKGEITLTIKGAEISNNTVLKTDNNGGSGAGGGGICIHDNVVKLSISDSTFSGNKSNVGGAIWFYGKNSSLNLNHNFTLSNCTFSANTALYRNAIIGINGGSLQPVYIHNLILTSTTMSAASSIPLVHNKGLTCTLRCLACSVGVVGVVSG